MTKHTPGGWVVERLFNVMAPHAHGGMRSVATTGGHMDSTRIEGVHAENVANARLMAAAPDLLEALKIALGFVAAFAGGYRANYDLKETLPSHQETIDSIQAVIAKAEGTE